jgi:hypothetical protein
MEEKLDQHSEKNLAKVFTYVESDASDLQPARSSKLLFAAYLFHGPGFDEELQFRVGTSRCGRYDVLWQDSDWNETGKSAAAWLPKGHLTRRALWEILLIALWQAEKAAYDYDGPAFNEVNSQRKSLLSSKEVWEIAERVWSRSDLYTN